MELMNNHVGKPEYSQVMNQCVELLSILMASQKKEQVEYYLLPFVNMLFTKKEEIGSTYFMSAWKRLCLTFDPFVDLGQYYSILLNTCREILHENVSEEDSISALSALNLTFKNFKMQAWPFRDETLSLAKEEFDGKGGIIGVSSVQEEALDLIVEIVESLKPSAGAPEMGEWSTMAQNVMVYLIHMVDAALTQDKYDMVNVCFALEGLKTLIPVMDSILSHADLLQLAEKLIETSRII
jgi:hypothetical protein